MAPSTSAQERIHQAALRLFAERGVTQVNVKELALAAGVARGTIYAHVSEPERLFEDVAGQLAAEMNERVALSFQGVVDPAHRLANGIRFYVRRAHEEPDWGRFINRFAFANPSMQQMWNGQPVQDLMNGVLEGRYRFQTAQLPSVVGLVAGGVLGAILLVLEGHQTWRAAGSDTAELVLIALGIHPYEAKSLATHELPALPDRSAP
ncbi:MAG: TetR/AcrR family transcriptional regulator [Aquabacterium sp.]|uniref:TetR/AcrR family transcriptional regulator n=1 Tax=Aquabacterium sp. TaxID=1872578 RepID=UPI0024899F40|nr:TetR/AcrR family transcriptional regulator [Aquabacterium sp.]MDI1258695.1 TetR/AcrR family transcriptional regulator [Aquabacterium sp.]MDO9001996.1 TetR/AcrR family transcriptional regulator [Aquabacterium sp.]